MATKKKTTGGSKAKASKAPPAPKIKTVKMKRDRETAEGTDGKVGVLTADVHPKEVVNYTRAGWIKA